jgi:hypothetical protein
MKGILYFFGGCLVIGLLISFGLTRIPALPMAGKAILTMIGNHQYAQAYSYFSTDFKNKYPLETFTQMVEHSGLSNFEKVEWFNEQMDKDKKKGYLSGMVFTTKKTQIEIEVDFVNEAAANSFAPQWLIDNMRVKPVLR